MLGGLGPRATKAFHEVSKVGLGCPNPESYMPSDLQTRIIDTKSQIADLAIRTAELMKTSVAVGSRTVGVPEVLNLPGVCPFKEVCPKTTIAKVLLLATRK